ncbi:MAG: Holliday junction branch migration protein RuvA [Patescibacteria group bacterium]
MISYLEGTVRDIDSKCICLMTTAGVGYQVQLGKMDLESVNLGDAASFYIYTNVREDALDLFGFVERSDKIMFEQLTSISGIGPRSALSILSLSGSEVLYEHVVKNNTAYLTQISGIGKKIAEKIVLELRDKLPKIAFDFSKSGNTGTSTHIEDIEVFEALKAMGYSAKEAKNALDNIPTGLSTTSEKIKAALRVVERD